MLVQGAAVAGPKYKSMGEDATMDAPPGLDVSYLEVARVGKDLDVRIGMANMLPAMGGYPELPGVEWLFTTGKGTYLAEAYVGTDGPHFLVFQQDGEAFNVLGEVEGTYDTADGFISILVPLKMIKAKKGTVITGAGENDVDSHVHAVVTSEYSDVMTSEGSYKI